MSKNWSIEVVGLSVTIFQAECHRNPSPFETHTLGQKHKVYDNTVVNETVFVRVTPTLLPYNSSYTPSKFASRINIINWIQNYILNNIIWKLNFQFYVLRKMFSRTPRSMQTPGGRPLLYVNRNGAKAVMSVLISDRNNLTGTSSAKSLGATCSQRREGKHECIACPLLPSMPSRGKPPLHVTQQMHTSQGCTTRVTWPAMQCTIQNSSDYRKRDDITN
jgi:hypothetical protein